MVVRSLHHLLRGRSALRARQSLSPLHQRDRERKLGSAFMRNIAQSSRILRTIRSDTGTTPPESGIFGFMINFSAFLGAATMYMRYKIVEKQSEACYFGAPVFNLVALVLGFVGCFGMGIVANFQELAMPVVHDAGALLAFVCGVVYTFLQSVISYKSCPQWNSHTTCHVRMVISAVSCVAVIPMIACASLISITKLEWNPKEKDYVYHVVSATCEWIVAFGFIFYFLTFIQDFQSVTLRISTEINDDF